MNRAQWVWLGLSLSLIGSTSMILFIHFLATGDVVELLFSGVGICLAISFIYDEWRNLSNEANGA